MRFKITIQVAPVTAAWDSDDAASAISLHQIIEARNLKIALQKMYDMGFSATKEIKETIR